MMMLLPADFMLLLRCSQYKTLAFRELSKQKFENLTQNSSKKSSEQHGIHDASAKKHTPNKNNRT